MYLTILDLIFISFFTLQVSLVIKTSFLIVVIKILFQWKLAYLRLLAVTHIIKQVWNFQLLKNFTSLPMQATAQTGSRNFDQKNEMYCQYLVTFLQWQYTRAVLYLCDLSLEIFQGNLRYFKWSKVNGQPTTMQSTLK